MAEFGLATSLGEPRVASDETYPSIDDQAADSEAQGWSCAAMAVHSIVQIPVPMFLRLAVPGFPEILVDFRWHSFHWDLAMEQLPLDPRRVIVETEPVVDASPLFIEGSRDLDALLWVLGINAFDGETAPWLAGDDRYRLERWPNFTDWNATPDQLRMTAFLSTVYLSTAELAAMADVDDEAARRFINAFSLMGILQTAEDVPVTAPISPSAPAQPSGLFRRLRARLGW